MLFIACHNLIEKWFIVIAQNKEMTLQNNSVFDFWSAYEADPLMELLHLSICFQCWMTIEWLMVSTLATSCVFLRGSASMIALRWLLSTSNGWPLGFSTFIFVFFAKLPQPLLPYTLVSSSWAKCVVYVASCLCCFTTILNSNKKITWICFLYNIISIKSEKKKWSHSVRSDSLQPHGL